MKYLKQFKKDETRAYCQFQAPIIRRYCQRYHVTEMFFVTSGQALHFDVKHHITGVN